MSCPAQFQLQDDSRPLPFAASQCCEFCQHYSPSDLWGELQQYLSPLPTNRSHSLWLFDVPNIGHEFMIQCWGFHSLFFFLFSHNLFILSSYFNMCTLTRHLFWMGRPLKYVKIVLLAFFFSLCLFTTTLRPLWPLPEIQFSELNLTFPLYLPSPNECNWFFPVALQKKHKVCEWVCVWETE